MVIIDPDNGFVHMLNKTGAYIFELLECSMQKKELDKMIQTKCEISPDDMNKVVCDIDKYLEELIDNDLIREALL